MFKSTISATVPENMKEGMKSNEVLNAEKIGIPDDPAQCGVKVAQTTGAQIGLSDEGLKRAMENMERDVQSIHDQQRQTQRETTAQRM